MAKTKPIGVRFNKELLYEVLGRGVKNAQQALILYEGSYKASIEATWDLGKKLVDAAKGRESVKVTNVTPSEQKSNYTINTTIPPSPKREDFEDNWAYLEAKNEWKKLYNQ